MNATAETRYRLMAQMYQETLRCLLRDGLTAQGRLITLSVLDNGHGVCPHEAGDCEVCGAVETRQPAEEKP